MIIEIFLTDIWKNINRLLTDYWQIIDILLTDIWQIIDRLLIAYNSSNIVLQLGATYNVVSSVTSSATTMVTVTTEVTSPCVSPPNLTLTVHIIPTLMAELQSNYFHTCTQTDTVQTAKGHKQMFTCICRYGNCEFIQVRLFEIGSSCLIKICEISFQWNRNRNTSLRTHHSEYFWHKDW